MAEEPKIEEPSYKRLPTMPMVLDLMLKPYPKGITEHTLRFNHEDYCLAHVHYTTKGDMGRDAAKQLYLKKEQIPLLVKMTYKGDDYYVISKISRYGELQQW